MFNRVRVWVLAAAIVLAAGAAWADVKLPAILGDNMVIQQDRPVTVWGMADPGEKVTVSLGGQTVVATANLVGRWKVRVGPLKSSSQPLEMTVAGYNTLTVRNILVGEVWVCSGQSNMAMPVSRAASAREEIAAADLPEIRLFTVTLAKAPSPQEDLGGRWVVCSPQTAGTFSAVGFYFGRDLYQAIKRPVGLINTSVGGTAIESWTPTSTYDADPSMSDYPSLIEKAVEDRPAAVKAFRAKHDAWRAASQQAAATRPAAGGPAASRPAGTRPATTKAAATAPVEPRPPDPPELFYGGLYNAMVAPLTPMTIGGAIWYQGESNAQPQTQYFRQLPAMIRAWRKAWGYDFPFLIVQLANFRQRATDPGVWAGYAAVREAQAEALSLPKTALASAIDIGEADNIHPKDKQTVGHRLALGALAVVYGKDVVYEGPMFESMRAEGEKLRVKFKSIGGGLVVKGEKLEGFAIAGADGVYHWADGEIDGDSVVLSSPAVAQPARVRYAWANNPACNLYNKEGLPAVPFRAGEKDPLTQPASAPGK